MASPSPVFTGIVDVQGKLHLDAKGVFVGFLRSLANKPIEIVVRVKRRQRSLNQNRWYFGVIVPMIAEHCGYQRHEYDALHDELVRVHLGLRPEPNPLKLRVSTSDPDFTTADFAEYCEQVRIWAATELGVVIPDPETAEAQAA